MASERKIELLKLLDTLENYEDKKFTIPVDELTRNILSKSTELFEEAISVNGTSSEVVLEAKVISSLTDICIRELNALDITLDSYDENEFADKIIEYLKEDDDINWNKLEDEAISLFSISPHYTHLYGTFDPNYVPENVIQKERKKRLKLDACTKKVPEQINALDKNETGVDETVKIMFSVLKDIYKENGRNPVSYYHFVVDPEQFNQTFENIFHFSFLVRDNAVKMEIDEKGILVISPRSMKENNQHKDNEIVQKSISLSISEWEQIKDVLNITECLYKKYKIRRSSKR